MITRTELTDWLEIWDEERRLPANLASGDSSIYVLQRIAQNMTAKYGRKFTVKTCAEVAELLESKQNAKTRTTTT